MDESNLLKAAAYVELNPVKANMVKKAEDYRWSSVHAHLKGEDPFGIVDARKLLEICPVSHGPLPAGVLRKRH